MKGLVKSNPDNNDYYVEQWEDDPWYPAIKQCHDSISEIVPNYNIVQIKDKFGGLRYYYDLPPAEEIDWDLVPTYIASSFTPMDELSRWCDARVLFAEAWVWGYEYARKEGGQ